MSNVTKYTRDAFKSLSLLEDVDFELTDKDSFQKLDTFINDDGDIPVETEVIDLDAENEEELKDSYVGDGILSCTVCHTNMFKAIEDVVIDEETGLCCVGEECPVCGNTDGFKILGKVAPFEEEEVEEAEVETEPDEAEVEIKEKVRESFKKKSAKKALKEKIAKRNNKQRLMEANLSNNAYTVIETSYDEEANKQEFNDLQASEVYFLKTLAGYVNAGFDEGQVVSLYKGNDLICEGEATSISNDFLETTETLALDSFSDRKENEPNNIKDFIRHLYGTRWLIEYLVDSYDFTDINDSNIDSIEADIFPTNEDKEDFINWIIKSCDSLHNVNESLTEEVSSIAYDMAEEIDKRFAGEKFISWDDFNEAFEDAYPGLIDPTDAKFDDLETDVRGILGYLGWETIFEGEDEGGLRLVESKSRTSKRLTEDKGDLNKLDQDIQDIVGEYFGYTMDFDFLDIVGDVLLRVDDFEEVAKDAWETVDSTLIYGDDQWNVLRHYVDSVADLGDGSWDDAFAQFVSDIEQICQRVAAQRGGEEVSESKKLKGNKKLSEEVSDYAKEDIKREIERIVDEYFKGTDFFVSVSNIDFDAGKVTLDISALGGYDEDSDEVEELNREVEFDIPNLDLEDYFAAQLEDWMNTHNSPDNFYESKELTEAPIYDLNPQFDSRKSFYSKAKVDTGDKGDKNKLYSYNTLVAELKDGKPVVYGTYSSTTLRHIKDWLKQLGFKADNAKQIMTDYGVTEGVSKKARKGKKLTEAPTLDSYEKGDFKAHYGKSEDPKYKEEPYWSNLNLFDKKGEVIGSFGFNRFEDEESAKKDFEKKKKVIDRSLGKTQLAKESKQITEAPVIARDVTDQVVVKRGEPGFISKMHDLRAQGYEMSWSGNGQMVFTKPKELVKTDPETGEIIESKQAITDSALKKFRSKKLTEKKKEVCPDCGKEICECDKTKAESLAEDIEKATIETENEVINLSSEEKEENMNADWFDHEGGELLSDDAEEGEEVVAPLSDDDVAEIEANSEEEETEEETFPEDEEEFEFDEVQEESFNRLGEQYLKKVYSNVDTFKLNNVSADNNKLVLEGVITFKSGKTKKTSFVFEKVENKNSIAKSKARYVGLNETFTDKKNAYVLNVKKNGKTLVAESLRYDYPAKTKNLNEGVKVVKGLVK